MGDNDHRRPGRCKADAAASSVEDLRATPIPLPNGGWVRLEELGSVTDTHADRTSLACLNSKPVIAMKAKRSKGYSDVTVTENVCAALTAFSAPIPRSTYPRPITPSPRPRKIATGARHLLPPWPCPCR
ncbi:efflux RND transporter permease subunit [Paracoccus litorisediminis]|uniref:efflux RND transporter permease subunit n=1 Tax=Paracoccus litorisediminis TaxID=2006130 RepID=UPI001B8AB23A|nr:efflux RND transporter permease subunit [Paracoccus litorisediminis]